MEIIVVVVVVVVVVVFDVVSSIKAHFAGIIISSFPVGQVAAMGSGIGSAVRVAAIALPAAAQCFLAPARGAVGGPIAVHHRGAIAAHQWCRIYRRRHPTGS